jgi:polysaccharide export outer membrane protein
MFNPIRPDMKQTSNSSVSIHKRTNKIFFFCFIYGFILSSCVTQKEVEYLQDRKKDKQAFNDPPTEEYRLKPADELYIQISSLDEASANIFTGSNLQQTYYMGTIQPYGASLMSYTVDKEGYIYLPVVGSMLVKDKTLTQVGEMIRSALVNVLNQPLVNVKLVNRYIAVLGEVNNPGHYVFPKNKLTIYEALGMAGDITEYGNRKEVLIIRNENSKNTRYLLNLTKPEVLSSDLYYLQPNDMVYVKPLNKKFWGLRQFPFTVVLSVLTTAVLYYNAFN